MDFAKGEEGMERLIVQLGIMSVQAAIVICVILLVRLFFSRLHVPKKYVMLLWIIPYFLMVCPWKIESSFSFWQVMESRQMDNVQTVVQHVQYELEQKGEEIIQTEEWRENVPREESNEQVVNMGALQEKPLTNGSDSSTAQLHRQDVTTITPINRNSMEFVELLLRTATVLWLVGLVSILVYSMVSYGKLKRKVLCSICVSENIYYADDIDSPFVLGIFRPRIYLPSSMKQENLHYVLEHERTHIRKKDPLKKMLAFGISIIHWFNPFVWVAFAFFGKDMEMACDEETIARLGIDKKQDYATALLQLASGKRRLLGAPLAFGEGNVKTRIRNIVKYKKVWKIVSVVAVLVVVVLAVGFLTKHNEVTTLEQVNSVAVVGEAKSDNSKVEQNSDLLPESAVQVPITKPVLTEENEGEEPSVDNNTVEATPSPLTEPITAEFTMEDLIALCKADKVAETMEDYVKKDGLLPSNIGRSYKEDALSWSYYFDLAYEGKSYTLRANYWNPLNAQEYGNAPNQLFEVILYENTAGDALMLYSNDYRHAAAVPIMDIEEFLVKKYDITQELTLELPEGTYLGAYDMGMNDIFQGSLILMEDYEENPHGEWIPKAWYAPGGVGKTALTGNGAMEGRAAFADNRLANFHWLMNHAGGELLEEVEVCDKSALLYHYQFDVFTMQEVEEYAQKHGISVEEVPNITDYWYVFLAEPESDFAYVVFLNQEYFSKEDILKLARSVKFQ